MEKEYYIAEGENEFGESYYGKLLIGPKDFSCYLGEVEDCTWYRDGRPVVAELNRLAEKIKELETEKGNLLYELMQRPESRD